MKTLEIVAALIRDGEKFLICQRPETKARALLWEFPGGKMEPGETRAQALARECREELAVELAVDGPFMEITHEYPDVYVRLHVLNAHISGGALQKIEHRDMRWITIGEAGAYPFCPADVAIVEKLANAAE